MAVSCDGSVAVLVSALNLLRVLLKVRRPSFTPSTAITTVSSIEISTESEQRTLGLRTLLVVTMHGLPYRECTSATSFP